MDALFLTPLFDLLLTHEHLFSLSLSSQWTYTCGNNWGNCGNGTGTLGCGPQEMFRACSDFAVEGAPVDHSNEIDDTTVR